MQIKSGIWFGIGFDMGIHQKPLISSTIGMKNSPSFKLVLGDFILD